MDPLRASRSALARALDETIEALWPARCRLCGDFALDALACARHALPARPPGARCALCAAALPVGVPDAGRCAECVRRAPGWGRLVALADYRGEPAVRAWLLAFKHGRRPQLAEPLGACLARRLPPGDAILVPVPLHPVRRLERGYDQAGLLAQAVARHARRTWAHALRRVRATAVQGALGARSRSANVRSAFRPRRGARRLVAGRSVWLVDDVVTSGSTASECARVLRAAGAVRVDVLTLARAARGSDSGVGYPAPP